MRGRKRLLVSLIACLITMIMASACQSPACIGAKPPALKYGWSPPAKMKVNNEVRDVRCMTVEDTETLRVWMITVQELNK
jgi:hypothetical protein